MSGDRVNIHTVQGRQALIAKLEDMNQAVHQLDLLVTNMERDLAQRQELLAELEILRQRHGITMEERHRQLERLFRRVWIEGESIYDKEVQRIAEDLMQGLIE